MKTAATHFLYLFKGRTAKRSVTVLVKFFLVMAGMILTYSALFRYLMHLEGQEFTWATAIYWTFTVMSTLGLGDITFTTDLGRIFSIVVLLSGTVWFLIMFPFVFIEFFYTPWVKAQAASRAPRQLPEKTQGHVILTHYDGVTSELIHLLDRYHYPYFLLVSEISEALRFQDQGIRVMCGNIDDPETYLKARIENAAMVVSTASDKVNTNVAFTVRDISKNIPIVTTALDVASIDILKLAGSTHVLEFGLFGIFYFVPKRGNGSVEFLLFLLIGLAKNRLFFCSGLSR